MPDRATVTIGQVVDIGEGEYAGTHGTVQSRDGKLVIETDAGDLDLVVVMASLDKTRRQRASDAGTGKRTLGTDVGASRP